MRKLWISTTCIRAELQRRSGSGADWHNPQALWRGIACTYDGVVVGRKTMTENATTPRPTPPKLRRVLELVYGVEGVVSARVWQWPGRIAVGVRGAQTTSPNDLIRRIEAAVAGLREADESWDFGILEDASPLAASTEEAIVGDDELSSRRRSLRSPS